MTISSSSSWRDELPDDLFSDFFDSGVVLVERVVTGMVWSEFGYNFAATTFRKV